MKKIILPPKKPKFKKQHKGGLTPIEWKSSASNVSAGIYGIQVLKGIRLTLHQLETIRRQISKYLKKSHKYWFRIIPDIPISKKPKEIRMGKGKGAIAFWALRLKAGSTFLEFSFVSKYKAKLIYNDINKRLPIPCVLIINLKRI